MNVTRGIWKPVLSAFGIALAATSLTFAQAQVAPPPGAIRIGVIDTEKILLNSATGKQALSELQKLQADKNQEVEASQKQVTDLRNKLEDGRLSLPDEQLQALQKELEAKLIALKRMQEDAQRELSKKRDEVLKRVDDLAMPAINQTGKELGYTLIFRKFESGLIYADDAIDITDAVIARLDANTPSD